MKNTILQISIFAQNKPGQIVRITKVLAKQKINILAFSISSSDGFGVIKLVVDKGNIAFQYLKEHGFTLSQNRVLALAIKDKPGGLYEMAETLHKKRVNVENAYVFVKELRKTAYLIIEVKNVEKALGTLKKEKIRFLQESEFSKE